MVGTIKYFLKGKCVVMKCVAKNIHMLKIFKLETVDTISSPIGPLAGI